MFADTGCRCGEVSNLAVDDLDFEEDTALVVGKRGRPRSSPFSDKTGFALRRYLRARAVITRARRRANGSGSVDKGQMTDHGIRQMLDRRAKAAGIEHIYPHMLRRWFAHNWLANGGQEQDLMMRAGWRSCQMLDRYGKSVADERVKSGARRCRRAVGLPHGYGWLCRSPTARPACDDERGGWQLAASGAGAATDRRDRQDWQTDGLPQVWLAERTQPAANALFYR